MVQKPTNANEKYLKHGPELSNFIAKHVDNIATVEELVQEVFLRVFKSAKWDSVENPRAYLFAITRNLLIDHFRSSKTRQSDNILEFDEAIHSESSLAEEKRIEARDDLRYLAKAMQKLPARTRKAFTLSRIFKYSYAEVGEMMGISPRTVEGHVAKGIIICTDHMVKLENHKNNSPTNNVIKLAKR